MWQLTQDPTKAPDQPDDCVIYFEKGIPVKLEYEDRGEKVAVTDALELFLAMNKIASRHGVGRVDIVSEPMGKKGDSTDRSSNS